MSELNEHQNLNNELIQNALINVFDDNSVKVLSFHPKRAVASGDNYLSDVFRVLVNYQTQNAVEKNITIIVKYILEIESVVPFIIDYNLFVKEKEIYTNFLPKLSKMFEENFAPKCYHIMEEPSKIFVMEDLKESGFILCDRQKGLDLDHSLLVVKKLAKWHAGSMILIEQEPEMVKNFDFGIINKNSTSGSSIPASVIRGLKNLIEEAEHWSGFEIIVQKLLNIEKDFEKKAINCIDQKSSFKVLNHGDLWTNNFMIQYDRDSENKPIDVSFVRLYYIEFV